MSKLRIVVFLATLLMWHAQAQQTAIGPGNVIRLVPTILPATCNNGDLQSDPNSSNALSICNNNTWATVSGSSPSPTTTLGDMIYNNGSALARLPGSTASTVFFLSQTGNGTISAAPAWYTASAVGGVSNVTLRDSSGNISLTAGNFLGNLVGNVTGSVTGTASAATAFTTTPTACSANQYAQFIAPNGNLTCAQVSFSQLSGTATTTQLPAPIQLADGSAATPSYSFSGETGSGWYRAGTGNPSLAVSGTQSLDIYKVSATQINFGFGGAAGHTLGNALSANYNYTAAAQFNYSNLNSGANSSTQFYIGAGPSGANGITIENQAYNTAAEVGGGGLVSAGPNLNGLNLLSEITTNGYIAFSVAGRGTASEVGRFTTAAFTLPSSTGLVLTGNNTAGGVLYTNGTAVKNVGQGASTQYLKSGVAGAPTWASLGSGLTHQAFFLTAASGVYTPSATAIALWVRCVGGGGGGGGVSTTSVAMAAGGAGGGGAGYLEQFITSWAANFTYAIGAGGNGGTTAGGNGTAGGTTTFSNGSINLTAAGGGGGGGSTNCGVGFCVGASSPGTATGASINLVGGFGGPSFSLVAGTQIVAGAGGGSGLCPAQGSLYNADNAAGGTNGSNYGCGGGGAVNTQSQVAGRLGGTGGNGICIVFEFD